MLPDSRWPSDYKLHHKNQSITGQRSGFIDQENKQAAVIINLLSQSEAGLPGLPAGGSSLAQLEQHFSHFFPNPDKR